MSTMPTQTDTPLAIYVERLPQVRREFHLFPDRVDIVASWTLGRTYGTTVRLADLSGQVNRFTVKNRWLPRAIMVASAAVGFALVLSRPGYPDLVRRLAGFGWPIAGLACVVAVFCWPRRQFVHFPRTSGKPGLDVCKAGPDRERFEDFVTAVRQRIQRS
jgi:hypothetical protein